MPDDPDFLLAPSLSTLDHPATLPDIAQAVERLISAIGNDEERKGIERKLVEEAVEQSDTMIGQGVRGLALWLERGHPGVHGIVASRVVECYGHPVVCLSPQRGSEGLVAGSARSVDGLHVLEVLRTIDRRHPGLFVKFGGHAMAAGLTISRDDVSKFQTAFSVAVGQKLDGRTLSPEL